MKKILLGIGSLFFVGMLSGCSSMPSCDDKEVKDLLTDIIKRNFSAIGIKVDKANYSDFMTQNVNKDAKKVTCKAKVEVFSNDRSKSDFLEYTAQHTDEGKLYVEIQD
nr:hypothetical protein [uncultured Helicobacter sp.]